MPATSKAQQRAAGAALSAKRGEADPADLLPASRQMFDSMTEDELEELAATKLDGLPDHVPTSADDEAEGHPT
jgi:hypothetical protein